MAYTDRLESISPEHAASAAGRATTDLGNWRSKGYLVGIGTKAGRAYVYNSDDVLAHIAQLAFLAGLGLGLPRANEIVKSYGDAIRAALREKYGRDLVASIRLRTTLPGLGGAADSDGPEALLNVNFSKVARYALARLRQCEKLARPRRRRSPSLTPSIGSVFIARGNEPPTGG